MSLEILLLFVALVLCLGAATGKVSEWPAVFVVIVALLVNYWR